jgi:hypothetical protein
VYARALPKQKLRIRRHREVVTMTRHAGSCAYALSGGVAEVRVMLAGPLPGRPLALPPTGYAGTGPWKPCTTFAT